MDRPSIERRLEQAAAWLTLEFTRRMNEKGPGAFASPHEALGVITEEYLEFVDAVHERHVPSMIAEALDIAVGCLWTVASLLPEEEKK